MQKDYIAPTQRELDMENSQTGKPKRKRGRPCSIPPGFPAFLFRDVERYRAERSAKGEKLSASKVLARFYKDGGCGEFIGGGAVFPEDVSISNDIWERQRKEHETNIAELCKSGISRRTLIVTHDGRERGFRRDPAGAHLARYVAPSLRALRNLYHKGKQRVRARACELEKLLSGNVDEILRLPPESEPTRTVRPVHRFKLVYPILSAEADGNCLP